MAGLSIDFEQGPNGVLMLGDMLIAFLPRLIPIGKIEAEAIRDAWSNGSLTAMTITQTTEVLRRLNAR